LLFLGFYLILFYFVGIE